jgi:hypothetical protein
MPIHLPVAPYFDLFQKLSGELDVAMLLKFEHNFGSKIEKPTNPRKIDRLDGTQGTSDKEVPKLLSVSCLPTTRKQTKTTIPGPGRSPVGG